MSNTAEVVTTEYAEAMNEAIDAANRAEAEATRLKRRVWADCIILPEPTLEWQK